MGGLNFTNNKKNTSEEKFKQNHATSLLQNFSTFFPKIPAMVTPTTPSVLYSNVTFSDHLNCTPPDDTPPSLFPVLLCSLIFINIWHNLLVYWMPPSARTYPP